MALSTFLKRSAPEHLHINPLISTFSFSVKSRNFHKNFLKMTCFSWGPDNVSVRQSNCWLGSAQMAWSRKEKGWQLLLLLLLSWLCTLGIWYSLILLTGTFTSWCACKRTQLICLMRKIVQITSLGLGNWKIMSFLQKNGFSCDLLSYSSLCWSSPPSHDPPNKPALHPWINVAELLCTWLITVLQADIIDNLKLKFNNPPQTTFFTLFAFSQIIYWSREAQHE